MPRLGVVKNGASRRRDMYKDVLEALPEMISEYISNLGIMLTYNINIKKSKTGYTIKTSLHISQWGPIPSTTTPTNDE